MSDALTAAIPSLWGAKEWQHAVFYLHTRIWCYFSAIEGAEILDVEEAAVDDVRRLQERSTEAVRAGATVGNVHDKLELALRYVTLHVSSILMSQLLSQAILWRRHCTR